MTWQWKCVRETCAGAGYTMATRYQSGYAFERRVRKMLEGMGYYVIRSAGSKGIADLVALGKSIKVLVQCKRSGAISAEEWNALHSKCLELGAVPLVAMMRTMMRGPRRGIAIYRILGPRAKRGDFPAELWSME